MKRKYLMAMILCLCCAFAFTSPVFALSKSTAVKTAKKYVPSGAVLKDTDREGDGWEVEFKKKKTEYTVLISSANKLLEKDMERVNMHGGQNKKVTAAKATAIVQSTYSPTSILKATARYDDGYVYKVAFKGKKYLGVAVVNRTNNTIIESTKVYKTSGYYSPFKAYEKALKKVKNGSLTDVNVDYEKKKWIYEFEMIKGNVEYEVKINAKTGALISCRID